MKRILLSLGLLSAFAVQASAVLNLEIVGNNNTFTLAPGGQLQVFGDVIGTESNGRVTSYSFTPGTGFSFAPSAAFQAFVSGTTNGATYGTPTAPLLLGTLTAGTAQGTFLNILGVTDSISAPTEFDGENLRVQITPEPASFAALGVGAIALLRRRRKA